MSINRQEFTNVGRHMLGRANNGEHLTFTNIVVGSGVANASSDLWPLSEVITHELDVSITQQEDQGDGVLILDCIFRSNDPGVKPQGFDLRELGAMAHIDNEPPQLYCVANVLATDPDRIHPGTLAIYAFKVKVVIDRATNVTVVIGESKDVLAENIGTEVVGPGWFKEKIANTLRFKRVVGEHQIAVRNANDNDSIIIGQRTLEIDLDLFVNPSFNNVVPNFNNLQSAIAYLYDYVIPSNRWATISVSGDRYVLTRDVTCEHLDSARIRIRGVAPRIVPVTNMNGTTANIVCSVANANTLGLAVGDVVILYDGPFAYEGGHRITAIGPTTITVAKDFQTTAPHNFNGPTPGASLQWNPTSFRNFGIFCSHGIAEIVNVSLVGTGPTSSTAGFQISERGLLRNVIGAEHSIGISGTGGGLEIEGYSAVSHNNWGVVNFETGSIYASSYVTDPDAGPFFWANCNLFTGVWIRGGISGLGTHHPSARHSTIITISNGRSGIESSNNASVGVGRLYSWGDRAHLVISDGGRMILGETEPTTPGGEDGGLIYFEEGIDYEILAEDASYAKYWYQPGSSNPGEWLCEPPLNDWSEDPRNGLSFIRWLNDPRYLDAVQRPILPRPIPFPYPYR